MSRSRNIIVWIIVAFIIITVGFIWFNSARAKEQSSKSSEKVYVTVKEVVDTVFGEDVVPVTHDGIRKTAHFFEFMALGAEFCALYITLKRESFKGYLEILPFGLYVSAIDEGIQILSDRGPEVRDVWLDYSGYLCALAVFFAVFLIRLAIKTKRASKKDSFAPKKNK